MENAIYGLFHTLLSPYTGIPSGYNTSETPITAFSNSLSHHYHGIPSNTTIRKVLITALFYLHSNELYHILSIESEVDMGSENYIVANARDKALDLVENGVVSAEDMLTMALKYMSTADVEDMLDANELVD